MHDAEALSPNRRRWRAFEVTLGAAAALPTVVGALLRTPLAIDDWLFASKARYVSFASGFGAPSRSRPIEGLWNWAEFRWLGTHPVPHLLILAGLNAATAVLFWRVLSKWLPSCAAVVTSLVWVALPNRGSSRLLSMNSPHMFSLVMLLAALLTASRRPLGRRRFGIAITMLVVATLAYEGAIAIGVVALVAEVWTVAPRHARPQWSAIVVAVMAAVGMSVYLNSPKRGGGLPFFRNVSHLFAVHFGAAVLPPPSRLVAIVVAAAIAWCVATVLLPGFRAMPEQNLLVVGLVVIVLGAVPFAIDGFPFSSSGYFDRANAFSDLGTALVYGSLLALLCRLPWRRVAGALAAAAIIAIALLNVRSVHNYVRAGRDGRTLLSAIDALPRDVRTKGPVTFAPLRSYGGMSEFLYGYDISGALALRYHTGSPFPRAVMAASTAAFRSATGPKYELVGRQLVRRG